MQRYWRQLAWGLLVGMLAFLSCSDDGDVQQQEYSSLLEEVVQLKRDFEDLKTIVSEADKYARLQAENAEDIMERAKYLYYRDMLAQDAQTVDESLGLLDRLETGLSDRTIALEEAREDVASLQSVCYDTKAEVEAIYLIVGGNLLTTFYLNRFAYVTMFSYYLWVKEVQSAMSQWSNYEDPKAAVARVRYKDDAGEDIDRWTALYDHWSELTQRVDGVSTTFGYKLKFYAVGEQVVAVVAFVYDQSPASKAHLKRGDVILTVNGQEMDRSNYAHIANDILYGGGKVQLGVTSMDQGQVLTRQVNDITLDAVSMYEDPVLVTRTFTMPDGKVVGYLHYTSFTKKSMESLVEVCRQFRRQHVTELILDLRYNSGGYVTTETCLASMLVPAVEVQKGSIYQTNLYNAALAGTMGDESMPFTTTFQATDEDGTKYVVNTADANIGLSKIYALVSDNTASASEALLIGLAPYMDVEIIGPENTSGKFCTGYMVGTDFIYAPDLAAYWKQFGTDYATALRYTTDWGIYIMVGRYADCNGQTPCMPNGLAPQVTVQDCPEEPYPLGDERERMLAAALQLAAGQPVESRLSRTASLTDLPVHLRRFGSNGLCILPAPQPCPVMHSMPSRKVMECSAIK